jgi:aminotransferase in exopolysaccharide biosynthesis
MEQKFIPLSVPNLKGNELKYIKQAIDDEWVSTGGSFITRFENDICEYLDVNSAAACQSGTAGLHLALKALNIQKDDEIIVPTLTFIAAVNPVTYIGAHPVFMDCDDSLCIDPEKLCDFFEKECIFDEKTLKNRLTSRIIKAILVVHVFGNLANMEEISQIAKKYNLSIIEDSTEALGTKYTAGSLGKKHAGTIGDIGVYSFNGNKIITTGGGGMVVSNNQTLTDRVKFLSTQAKKDTLYFVHDEIGYNYRMTNLQAAVGVAQLEQLEDFINKKEQNYRFYQQQGVSLLSFRPNTRPNYWFYSHLTSKRDELIEYMRQNNVQIRPIWSLIHTQKCYENCQHYKIEKAHSYWGKVVNLPCSSNLQKNDIKIISGLVLGHHID